MPIIISFAGSSAGLTPHLTQNVRFALFDSKMLFALPA